MSKKATKQIGPFEVTTLSNDGTFDASVTMTQTIKVRGLDLEGLAILFNVLQAVNYFLSKQGRIVVEHTDPE